MFDVDVSEGVCRFRREGTRWLSTGYAGGESTGPVAYNVTVPEGWTETDIDGYVDARLDQAGFAPPGPTLLTGVSMDHARRARLGPVEAVVTAGVSNPAALPMPSDRGNDPDGDDAREDGDASRDDDPSVGGTINVVVGTTRALDPGALANLVAVAAEAKAATLLSRTSAPGTTTDAVIAACDPAGERVAFSGSATPVGRAARVCVRDALLASLDSRYADAALPTTVADAEYGVVADERATVSTL